MSGRVRGPAGRVAGRVLLAAVGAVAARAVLRTVTASPAAGTLERTNHRGGTVSLAAGPAMAVAASAAAALGAGDRRTAAAALAVGLSAGAAGLYDDVVGQRADQRAAKGFRGHLGALREGRVTSGLVKLAGIGTAGVLGAALADRSASARRGPVAVAADTMLGAGVIAGSANLANLFDLRPGRALKVGLVAAGPLLAGPAGPLVAGTVGASGALLPADLGERAMLGDTGANAMGALLGLATVRATGRRGRLAALVGIAALTLASERISFTTVIESTPVLRDLDAWGRRPVGH